jgi:lipopolysaccharide/colanic/teichoic acid biosynthesis glycosyltransferase
LVDHDDLEGSSGPMDVSKRLIDVVLGTALAILCLPFMLLTALVAAIALRAWPLFVQERIGRGGKVFRLVKIRTLPPTAPKYAAKYDLTEVEIPPATAFLRRFHLDELPQLLLVPFGRMSLVGPRPEMELLNDGFDGQTAELRASVRPGCTGLWQVSTRSEGLIREAPEYDLFYVEHKNMRLDLWIMWRTFCLMVLNAKPVTLDTVPSWTLRRELITVPLAAREEEPSAVDAPA